MSGGTVRVLDAPTPPGRGPRRRGTGILIAAVLLGVVVALPTEGPELATPGPEAIDVTEIAAPAEPSPEPVRASGIGPTGGFDRCDPTLTHRLVALQSAVTPPPLDAVREEAWQLVDLDRSACRTSVRLHDLTLSWRGLVAVGSHRPGPGEPRAALIWASRDGLTWFLEPDTGPFTDDGRDVEMLGVAAIPGSIVAVGRTCRGQAVPCAPAVWRAPLGEPWERVEYRGFEEGDLPVGVVADGDRLLAFGRRGLGGAVWTSPDGTPWLVEMSTGPQRRVLGVAVGAEGQAVAWGSFFGSRFDRRSVLWHRDTTGRWTELAYDPEIFGGTVGPFWFPAVSEVIWDGARFVAVGQYGGSDRVRAIWQSPDGRSWERIYEGVEGRFDHVVRHGTQIVTWSRRSRPTLVRGVEGEWRVAGSGGPPIAAEATGGTRVIVRSLLGTTALVDLGGPQLWTSSSGRL